MTQYLLALHKADNGHRSPEQTRQVWADVNALYDRMTDGPLQGLAGQRPIEIRPFFDGDLDDAILAPVRQAVSVSVQRP
jgi:hypothetical protein